MRRREHPLSIRNMRFSDPVALLLEANRREERGERLRPRRGIRWISRLMFVFGAGCLALWIWALLDARVYQAIEEFRFAHARGDRAMGAAATPAGEKRNPARRASPAVSDVIGRIAIPRLRVAAIVREGVDETTLRRAVGHIPGTALPGQAGNAGLAAHRDTFFQALRNIRRNDLISVATLDADYRYQVESIRIVGPDDVQVLETTAEPTLTLVTCYPFHYVGNAPRRFIVRARRVGPDAHEASNAGGD